MVAQKFVGLTEKHDFPVCESSPPTLSAKKHPPTLTPHLPSNSPSTHHQPTQPFIQLSNHSSNHSSNHPTIHPTIHPTQPFIQQSNNSSNQPTIHQTVHPNIQPFIQPFFQHNHPSNHPAIHPTIHREVVGCHEVVMVRPSPWLRPWPTHPWF